MRRLILLNPYSAGSHALWERGVAEHVPSASAKQGRPWQIDVISLPGRHWKWRMHAAAWTLVQRMTEGGMLEEQVDAFLVTDMLDVGQFRAALPSSHRHIPILLYFHENQLTFPEHPERPAGERDRHYGWLNLTSALLADAVLFNSEFHRSSFLGAIPGFLKQLPSPRPVQAELQIGRKSEVLAIGLEEDLFQLGRPCMFGEGPPVIVWNHRWEHDKGPQAFLEILVQLREEGVAFRLAVLGEEFGERPTAFDTLQEGMEDRIVHWGFAESRQAYLQVLASCDVALVTAHHDFFGISVLESAAAGLQVVAPREQAYPDHFPSEALCDRGDLAQRLKDVLSGEVRHAWADWAMKRQWRSVARQWCAALDRIVSCP